jgi:hypothetical protein
MFKQHPKASRRILVAVRATTLFQSETCNFTHRLQLRIVLHPDCITICVSTAGLHGTRALAGFDELSIVVGQAGGNDFLTGLCSVLFCSVYFTSGGAQ